MLQALTFGVTGALIHCPRLGDIYAEVLGRHGLGIEPSEARRLVGRWSGARLACLADRSLPLTAHPEGSAAGGGVSSSACASLSQGAAAEPASPRAVPPPAARRVLEVYPEVPRMLVSLRE